MHSREIVRRAIESDRPPRLPFWQHVAPAAPDDVWEIWEMDRAEAGWFLDNATMFDAVHKHGWHVILQSCGRINDFVPRLIEVGVDAFNMQQPRAYDLVEFGKPFCGKVCFTVNPDIQKTLPGGDEREMRDEVGLLVKHWGTPEGGILVADPGEPKELGVEPEAIQVMFDEFVKMQDYWHSVG